MKQEFNVYCDESCHSLDDGSPIMVLGGVWCPKNNVRNINERIRDIKAKHSISHEMKWTKISESKKSAYFELINYFFDNNDLHFRVLIVDNKNAINHVAFHQTHDEWYYKMYFRMLENILHPQNGYNIYMDIKDTKSKSRIKKLNEVLSNSQFDFSRKMIQNIQVIRSHEVEIMQIADILIGAMGYFARNLSKMNSKNEIVELIQKRSGYALSKSTLYQEDKFNIFHLQLSEGEVNG